MMSRLTLMLCSFFGWVQLQNASVALAADAPFTEAGILSSIEDAEAALTSFTVTSNWTLGKDGLGIGGPPLKGKEIFLIETSTSAGRVRVESEGQTKSKGDNTRIPEISVSVFDGVSSRMMRGRDSYVSGLIADGRDAIQWRFDPQDAVWQFKGRTISALLSSYNPRITDEHAGHNGLEVIVIETEPVRTDMDRRFRFFISPAYGFAVVYRALEAKMLDGTHWIAYETVSTSDYSEIAQGVWLPRTAVQRYFDTTEDNFVSGSRPKTLREIEVRFSDWEVNPVAADESFQLKFAPGVYVTDRVGGKNFQVEGISDALIEAQAREAMKLTSDTKTNSYWLIVLNTSVVVILLGVLLYRRFANSG